LRDNEQLRYPPLGGTALESYGSIRKIEVTCEYQSETFTSNLGRVLLQATSLEVLSLDLAGIHGSPKGTILQSVRSDRLSSLRLECAVMVKKDLKALVQRHHGTIRHLSFLFCVLIDGNWLEVLYWATHTLPSLEVITLHYLLGQYTRSKQIVTSYGCDHRKSLEITGKENIIRYFDTLVESRRS
jgi:hypothetical protein